MGRGVVASASACLLLASCSGGTIDLSDHRVLDADRTACQALVDDLPATLDNQARREVEPKDALGAAWGDPAYVLVCGVLDPLDYEPTAECSVIAGVGWYVTDDQLRDPRVDATPIALSLSPYVEVVVPSEYRTKGIDKALSELAPVLQEHLGEGLACL